jgi:type I restriction enzyme S subunit
MNSNFKLGDLADYSKDRISIENVDVNNFITTDNLLPNKLGVEVAVGLPPVVGQIPSYAPGDILISNIRPYLKKIWLADKHGGCSADVLILRSKDGVDSRFLYYNLIKDDFFEHMMNGAKGTKMPRGDKSQVLDYLIPRFDLTTQSKISHFLSTLDDLVSVNNKMNKILESMVKQIFHYWFVQFDFPGNQKKPYKQTSGKMCWNESIKREIPDGWKVIKMSELYEFQYGSGNVNPDNGGEYPVYGSNGIIGGYDKFNNEDSPVIGHIGNNCGSLVFASGKHFVTYNGVMCKIKNNFDKYFGYSVLQNQDLKSHTRGSSQRFISYDILNSLNVTVPDDVVLQTYCKIITPIFEKIIFNSKHNLYLSNLRDWIAPLLMSGQVRITAARSTL